MKIAIIGGGISGCTTYLFLKKHLPATTIDSITIYEAYPTPSFPSSSSVIPNANSESPVPVIGGGLGLAPNGLNVLSRLDPSQALVQDIVRSGYAIRTMALKTKRGGVLAEIDSSSDLGSVPEVFASRSDIQERDECSSMRMNMVASSRHALWGCLRARVADEDVVTRKVERVVPKSDGLNIMRFEGGGEVEVDLVVGADGLRSVARRGMFAMDTEGDEEYEYGPQYEGLVGIGGFTPLPPSLKSHHLKPGTMSLLLSGNGFFGYYPSSSALTHSSDPDHTAPPIPSPYTITPPGETLSWWSTYAHPSPPPTPSSISLSDVTAALKTRHASWSDPIVKSILDNLTVQNIYPTWTSPVLPTWEKHGVILVGDAAHALPSTSGQGVSQGVEDGEALSLFLGYYLTEGLEGEGRERGEQDDDEQSVMRTKRILTQAAKQYIDLRKPRVEMILNDAKRKQNSKRDVGWIGEVVMYAVLWVMGLFPGWFASSNKQILNYNVVEEVERML